MNLENVMFSKFLWVLEVVCFIFGNIDLVYVFSDKKGC